MSGWLYGSARYQHRQCGSATHRWQSGGKQRRKNLGTYQLFGLQYNSSAAKWMAGRVPRTEALLFDLHYVLHGEFLPLWDRTQPWVSSPVSSHARRVRWRLAADGPVHPGGWLRSREAGAGLLALPNHTHLR